MTISHDYNAKEDVSAVQMSITGQEDEMQSSASVSGTFETSSFAQSEPSTMAPTVRADLHDIALPAYACAYCGCSSPQSVIQCTVCKRWFCNGQSGARGSHIVIHMTMSHHNSLALHPESEMGDTPLECYKCGNKNVFSLGFVAAKEESVVVLLCRLPCAQTKQNPEWDMEHWQPLIDGRHLLPWLARPPQDDEMVSGVPGMKQISDLEAMWRESGQQAASGNEKLGDGAESGVEDAGGDAVEALEPVQLVYKDGFEYQRTFGPLVEAEANYFHRVKESKILKEIKVRWSVGVNKKKMASFILPSYEFAEFKMAVGDEIRLTHEAGPGLEAWQDSGYVVRLPGPSTEELTVQMRSKDAPMHVQQGFSAELVWKSVPYDRMQEALKRFALDQKSVSKYLYYKLLGKDQPAETFDVELPARLSVSKELELNASQLNAVQTALRNPLTLIQGPPGTGKTVTSATIVYQLCRMRRGAKGGKDKAKDKANDKGAKDKAGTRKPPPVLVCAPSNVAVDHLTLQLARLGLRVVRVAARGWTCDQEEVEKCSLDSVVARTAGKRLRRLLQRREETGELSEQEYREYTSLVRAREAAVVARAEVVCCTCVTAGSRQLPGHWAACTVLIDESTQATEPECLIPIARGARQVILVGDHQQLGPVIGEPCVRGLGLGQSLFERLILLGNTPVRLEVQYRMHPGLAEFSSNVFYEGSLHNGVSASQRSGAAAGFPWPIAGSPLMFWACFGPEELSSSGVSYLNRTEATNCFKIVSRMFSAGVSPEQIGIVTPYEGQRHFISSYMLLNAAPDIADALQHVEVVSVDAFQGREKDFIIFSCVRSNDFHQLGFLRDPRRLNVALTRARYGLIILGNPITLSRDRLWASLLHYYRDRGCLVEGQLGRMRVCSVRLGAPAYARPGPRAQRYQKSDYRESDTATLVSCDASVPGGRENNPWPTIDQAERASYDRKRNYGDQEQDYDDQEQDYGDRGQDSDDRASRSVIESFTNKFASEFTF